MARVARVELFDAAEVSVFHCINRCVRQAYLCGQDRLTGRNFDHRKRWLEKRLEFLAGQFAIDVLAFAVMSNHFHLVLRNRPDLVATWSDDEVARRWLRLCPLRKEPDGSPADPTDAELATIVGVPGRLAEIRRRLSDLSWLMRMIAEPIARRANAEDQTTGRFWRGRFKAIKLLDEAAILACVAYVDLNPIRAGLAETLEQSRFTSAKRRVESLAHSATSQTNSAKSQTRPDGWLAPVDLREAAAPPGPQPDRGAGAKGARRGSVKGFLPMTAAEYLDLVEWTGRQFVRGKSRIPDHILPLVARLGIAADDWLSLTRNFGRLFHRIAGAPHAIARQSTPRFRPGRSALLGSA